MTSDTAAGELSFPPRRWRPATVWAAVRRDYRIRRTYRVAFVMEIAFGVINILTFLFISRTFPQAAENLGGAPSYFAFAAVGVVITTVMQASATGVALKLREEQLTGTLEILATQPIRSSEIAIGLGGYPLLIGIGRAGLYLALLGMVFGADFSDADWLGTGLTLLATALAVTVFGILVAALVLIIKRAEVLAGLSVFALALLGGAYFPLSVFPGWLEAIAEIAPSRYIYEGVRDALFVGEGWFGALGALGAFVLVGLPIALGLFGLALRRSKKRGSLSEY